ncbi:MAG TPA: glycosyltransferase family 2 protein [Candidatus Dormibacteraeota bacterium]|nr:glycosyltransferase family 2 protein [Candidatus Dormibacteraeota bacterium]
MSATELVPVETPAGEAGMPTVSVVIPTRNRAAWLAYTLHAVALQVYPSELVEVIVVDNSSTDNTEEVVRAWADRYPFPLHFHRKANEGPAASRNYAAARATGEVIAFTDSDCMPEPDWLANGVRALERGVGLVTGLIIPRRTEDTHFFFNAQLGAVLRDDGLYRTASLIVPRAVFDAIGGFDETYALGRGGALLGGEDTDLGWRIRGRHLRAVFSPDVRVVHLATPISLRGWMRRAQLAQIMPRLVRAFPQLRETVLWHRYFHMDDDFFFIAGAAGVVIALFTGWWPFAVLPLGFLWANYRNIGGMVRKGRLDKAAAMLVLLVARTGVRVGVLSYASVKYRCVVL